MQIGKPRAVGVDPEYRASTRTATLKSRAVKAVARHNQSGDRVSPVAVALGETRGGREMIQAREPRAICLEGEDRGFRQALAFPRRSASLQANRHSAEFRTPTVVLDLSGIRR